MRDDNKKIARPKGILYGIGIGPGEPELLTLKARKILKKVDIIFAPAPDIKSGSRASDIIKDYVRKNRIRGLLFPMTKDKKRLQIFWEEAALRVYREISLGKDVAFITVGDPFIYSTYIYLLSHIRKLDKELKVVTIPGISAINATASLLEIPLAKGDERFAVMPLPDRLEELKSIFSLFDTVVLLKIGKKLGELVKFLKKEGLNNASFLARRIGHSGQYLAKDISTRGVKTSGYLSTMIIKPKKRANS